MNADSNEVATIVGDDTALSANAPFYDSALRAAIQAQAQLARLPNEAMSITLDPSTHPQNKARRESLILGEWLEASTRIDKLSAAAIRTDQISGGVPAHLSGTATNSENVNDTNNDATASDSFLAAEITKYNQQMSDIFKQSNW